LVSLKIDSDVITDINQPKDNKRKKADWNAKERSQTGTTIVIVLKEKPYPQIMVTYIKVCVIHDSYFKYELCGLHCSI
jgi:hypothetical protein